MIRLKTKKKKYEMSIEEFARWMCLTEAFHYISKRADELNVNYEDMIKPMAIEKYISERYPSMIHDVKIEYAEELI